MPDDDKAELFARISVASFVHADSSDGAYYEILRDVVRLWNFEKGTNYDSYDTVNDWIDQRSDPVAA
jgi:hypothetical protein